MTTTTSYGTWQNFTPGELSLRQGIEKALEGYLQDHNVDAIETEYRDLINGWLKGTGIQLHGDEFYGPAVEGYGNGYIAEVVGNASLTFWDIARKHSI